MGYTYTPAYYSSFQDSITSLCKSILPFSFKKRGLPVAEYKLSKQQTDYLKWQQESFHQILNLMGLHREGILPESEVSEFKSQLLETIIASKGTEHEQPVILRDKLLFLQELLYAKCISVEEYRASKRPLLQRLAMQGAQIEARDVIPGGAEKNESFDEEWSVIDLKDEQCLINKDKDGSKNNLKPGSSAIKHITGTAAKALSFGSSSQTQRKNRAEKSIFDHLGSNGSPNRHPIEDCETGSLMEFDKVKRKGFLDRDEITGGKKQWGFKKWNRGNSEEETAPLPLNSNLGEGPDTNQIKKKLHSDGSASDFFIDKVLGGNIKKELARIQAELSSKNTNLLFSNDEMETISNKLPVDKADLQKFFPKSWCDRHGEVVLDVVKKEFKGHICEMENTQYTQSNSSNPITWATFDDDENCHPNLFSHPKHHGRTNPFLHQEDDNAVNGRNRIGNQSFSNPFWNSSTLGS